jgi:ABC-type branched-subunit amino acid transport system substrate-binding protein
MNTLFALNRRNVIRAAAASLLAGGLALPALAEDGVTDKEIRIGMANAQSGPASGLGTQLKAGAEAYLAKVNAAGGVNGRKVSLVSLDDGYEPDRAAAATRKLIDDEKVFSLFGYVGTPTSAAAVPLASKAGLPYLFPFTGAEFLRNPVNKWVFNVRASYFDETETMVERLTGDLGVKNIALFIQDDAFGEAGKAGTMRALHKRSLKLAEEARYKRNTVDVDEGLAKIKAAQPEAVIFVGTYKSLAATVKKAKAMGITAKFLTVSFIGTSEFIKEAGSEGDGVYITQVMPSPDDASIPLVKQYQQDMKGGDHNYTSLEGYANAVVLVEALKKAGAAPTRAGLVGAMEGLSTDIGGVKIAYSSASHQGAKQVFITKVQGGKAVSVTKL